MALPGEFGAPEPLDVVSSQGDGSNLTLEFFYASAAREPPADGDVSPALMTEGALDPGLDTITDRIAKLTGLHRVMLYIFQDNGDGEVVEETRQGGVYGSYLGLRYPASDIPAIARQLYLKNPWRLIPDAEQEPVPVLSAGLAAPDLTYSDLRSVSPVHRIYLRNMEVRASLSFPIIIAGSLFALVACHHQTPRQPSLRLLERASQAVNIYALAVSGLRFQNSTELLNGFVNRFETMREFVCDGGGIVSGRTLSFRRRRDRKRCYDPVRQVAGQSAGGPRVAGR